MSIHFGHSRKCFLAHMAKIKALFSKAFFWVDIVSICLVLRWRAGLLGLDSCFLRTQTCGTIHYFLAVPLPFIMLTCEEDEVSYVK